MIDWNKHERAVYVNVTYFDEEDKSVAFQRITRPTQTKTVADAVEWAKGEWKEGCETIWLTSGGFFEWGCQVTDKTICTREQFEAYVKEQEGEKWTHTMLGEKCFIKESTPDVNGYIILNSEKSGYIMVQPSNSRLKPIKPTMTAQDEAALVEFMKSSHKLEVINEVRAYIREHDII